MAGNDSTPDLVDDGSGSTHTFSPSDHGGHDASYSTEILVRAVTYYTIGSIGFLGNLMVVIVIFQYTKMRQNLTNVYVINQSVIDGAAGLVLILSRLFQYNFNQPRFGPYGEFLCRVWAAKIPLWSLLISSTWNLVALTLERYIAVMHPIYHKTSFTRGKVVASVVLVWTLGPFVQLCYKTTTGGLNEDGRCEILSRWPAPGLSRGVSVLLITLEFIFPLVFITYCYSRLFFKLKTKVISTGPAMAHSVGSANSDRNAKARKNILKTMIIVSVCYLLCWIWNEIYYFGVGIGVIERNMSSIYVTFGTFMVYINCCANPIIYVIHYNQFKKGLRLLQNRIFKGRSTVEAGDSERQTSSTNTNVTS